MKNSNLPNFSFTPENLAKAEEIIKRYPLGRQKSAILPLLDIAQRQSGGWLPRNAIEYVSKLLNVPYMRTFELVTFYTMLHSAPLGKNHVQVCGTTPCLLRGADEIIKTCIDNLGIKPGETDADKQFSLSEVECLGACVNAPMVQINDDYYEDLNPEIMAKILADLKQGKKINYGSQVGRNGSSPK